MMGTIPLKILALQSKPVSQSEEESDQSRVLELQEFRQGEELSE